MRSHHLLPIFFAAWSLYACASDSADRERDAGDTDTFEGHGDDSDAFEATQPQDTARQDGELEVEDDNETSDVDDIVPDDVQTNDVGDLIGDVDDVEEVEATEPTPWRSALYPENWTPSMTDSEGRFLHDFSYAGYRLGEDLPDLTGLPTLSLSNFGALADGSADTAPALLAAIAAADSAADAPVVIHIPAGLYRFDQRVVIEKSGIILRGDGPTQSLLHFTSAASTAFSANLTFSGRPQLGPHVVLSLDGEARSNEVWVDDATGFEVGEEVAIGWTISEAFIADHRMAEFWRAFNGTWQPFFRRRVVSIDMSSVPHRVTVDVPLRYPALVRDGASVRRLTGLLRGCGLVGVGIANAVGWNEAWSKDQVHAVALDGVVDCYVSELVSFPSPSSPLSGRGAGAHLQSSGLLVRNSHRVTVTESELGHSQNRGGGGNGYLFEVRQSNEVLFKDLTAREGRHNFIQNWGFGVTGVVWLRTRSYGGRAQPSQDSSLATTGYSEFHHSLATANLIDASFADDGWSASNRRDESTGAGHTATQNVFWNLSGPGTVRSYQFGMGYVIGTSPTTLVQATLPDLAPEVLEALTPLSSWYLSEPWDWVEGEGLGHTLEPPSLYEDQRRRRLEHSRPRE